MWHVIVYLVNGSHLVNMKKTVLLSFSFLLVCALAGCQNGAVIDANIFRADNWYIPLGNQVAGGTQGVDAVVSGPGKVKRVVRNPLTAVGATTDGTLVPAFPVREEPAVIGAVVSPREYTKMIERIDGRKDYLHVVILAPTFHKTTATAGVGKIFTYDDAGVLADRKFVLDKQIIGELVKNSFAVSLGKVGKESYWNRAMTEDIARAFPGAAITPLSINGELNLLEGEVLANALRSYLPERSIVLAVADFQDLADENAALFMDGFTDTVMKAVDANKADSLALANSVPLRVLFYYLGLERAKNVSDAVYSGSERQVAYAKGERGAEAEGSDFDGASLLEMAEGNSGRRGAAPAVAAREAFSTDDKTFIVAFGDIMLGRYVRSLMNATGLDYPFVKMDEQYLKVNDILLANLEGPIARKEIKTGKSIAFRFMPDVAPLLKKYSFDLLSLANNHAYDMGQAGYDDSKELLDAQGIVRFGDARDINDDSVAKVVVRGRKFAFLGLEEVVFKIDDEAAVKKVEELAKEGYKVIPFVHMGVEYQHSPSKRQTEFYRKMIDAGAFMVIGHHPHVAEGYERYNGRLIFYSLGNAVFDQYWSADTQEGLSLAIEVGERGVTVYLMPISIVRSQMKLMTGVKRDDFLRRFADWSGVTGAEREDVMRGVVLN